MSNSSWVTKIQAALAELAAQYDPTISETSFVFHPLYRVGVSENSTSNIEQIFGKSTVRRFRHFAGNLKKVDWIKNEKRFVAKLPADSIIFFRADKEGVIIASHEKQIALKMFFDQAHIHLLEEEIATLKAFEGTTFAPYAAKILDEGKTSNGGRWLVTNFCANTQALTGMFHHEKFLLKYFSRIVMPGMTEFYKSFEPTKVSIDTWLDQACLRVEKHPDRKKLELLLTEIALQARRFPDYQIVESRIHHDLHAGNILVNDNHAVIIDWEGQVRGSVMIDVFDFTRRYLHTNFYDRLKFDLFMGGFLRNPPKLVNDAFKFYRNWMLVQFNAKVSDNSCKMTFMIYALERALIMYEHRGLNRFQDKRGIETHILKAIE